MQEHAVFADVDGLEDGPVTGRHLDVRGMVEGHPHRPALLRGPLGEKEADLPPDVLGLDGLDETVIDPAQAGRAGVGAGLRAVDDQDLDDGLRLANHLLEKPDELDPLHAGKVVVDDEDLGFGQVLDELQGLDARGGRVDRVLVLESLLEPLEIGQVVVHDEDDGLLAHLLPDDFGQRHVWPILG